MDLDRPSRKLGWTRIGPYPIIKKVGTAYRLQLPPGINRANVFHPSKLTRDDSNPLPGQMPEPQPAVQVDNKEEYVVESILDSRYTGKGKKLQYRVQWADWPPDLQWYPADNFNHAVQKLKEFHDSYPKKPGPPNELQRWI
ncbi:Reverse transcriptase [Neofusicoccum parvum]|nr:Reverse transcriptase [Neofusicoccum parvum]